LIGMANGINKIDGAWYCEQAAIAERQNREHVAKHDRSFNAIMAKFADDERERDDAGGNASDHHASKVADLLVESGRFPHRTAALDHLLNSSRGSALLARMSKAAEQTEKEPNMRSESLETILKDSGPVSVCKAIVDRGRSPCGEHELVAALTKAASEQHPELSSAQAFAELYKTESVWRACAIAKSMPFQVSLAPLQVGAEAAQAVNDPSEAIEQLKKLGRDKWPSASESDQFERALTDPVNHKLARLAVPIPRPTTAYPFPRG
jgi:hypothetical protein